jgi:hypothetical protein
MECQKMYRFKELFTILARLRPEKKTEKKVWPSWLVRVGFGRVVWQSRRQQ